MNEQTQPAGFFSLEQAPDPDDHGIYVQLADVSPIEFVKGLTFKPVLTDDVLVNFVDYEPGTVVPLHSHAESQITFVIDGEFEFDLDGEVRTMKRGAVAVIPPWVPHAARTYETRCFQIDVFQPPRSGLRLLLPAIGSRNRAETTPTGT